jgi:hypothetical protein
MVPKMIVLKRTFARHVRRAVVSNFGPELACGAAPNLDLLAALPEFDASQTKLGKGKRCG